MNEKVNAALEAALVALKEAQHRLYCAANAADDGAAERYTELANKADVLIDEVEDLQG